MTSSGLSSHDPAPREGEFSGANLTRVRNCFSPFENVRILPGPFKDTLPRVQDERFAFVYYDADLYEPAIECCSFFYERLPPGGMLLLHDYCSPEPELPKGAPAPFTGVKKAVDQFLAGREDRLLHFPETTHALIVKA
jgi:O-methyltransferase